MTGALSCINSVLFDGGGEQVQAYEWLKRYAKERFGIDG